jgi:hypothetical protein
VEESRVYERRLLQLELQIVQKKKKVLIVETDMIWSSLLSETRVDTLPALGVLEARGILPVGEAAVEFDVIDGPDTRSWLVGTVATLGAAVKVIDGVAV